MRTADRAGRSRRLGGVDGTGTGGRGARRAGRPQRPAPGARERQAGSAGRAGVVGAPVAPGGTSRARGARQRRPGQTVRASLQRRSAVGPAIAPPGDAEVEQRHGWGRHARSVPMTQSRHAAADCAATLWSADADRRFRASGGRRRSRPGAEAARDRCVSGPAPVAPKRRNRDRQVPRRPPRRPCGPVRSPSQASNGRGCRRRQAAMRSSCSSMSNGASTRCLTPAGGAGRGSAVARRRPAARARAARARATRRTPPRSAPSAARRSGRASDRWRSWPTPTRPGRARRAAAVTPSGPSGIVRQRIGRRATRHPRIARSRHVQPRRLAGPAIAPPDYPVRRTACGRSVVVAQKPSKLLGRVRFPSPAC